MLHQYATLSSKSGDDNLKLALDVATRVANSRMRTATTGSEVDDVLSDTRKEINELMRTFAGCDLAPRVKDELDKKVHDSQIMEKGVRVTFVASVFMRGFMAMIRSIVLGKYVFN
jgi:hypothetical protein